MKKLMMALAAFCVAGAASAVTIDWDDVDWDKGYQWEEASNYTSNGTPGSSTAGTKLNLGKTFNLKTDYLSITTVFTINSALPNTNGFKAIFSLYGSSTTGKDQNFRLSLTDGKNSNPLGAFTLNGTYSSGDSAPPKTNKTAVADQKYSATLVFQGGTANLVIYTVAADGTLTEFASLEHNLSNGTYNVDSIILGTASALEDNGNRTFANGALTIESMTILPEPTALALLALGVAGLALRRKVA